MSSPNNTVISLPGQAITDADGNSWAISNGQVTVNGQVDSSTGNVIEMAYEGGVIWQKNTQNLWYGKNSPGASWSPTYGTRTDPIPNQLASASDTVLLAEPSQPIYAALSFWTISRGQVVINGVPDPTTSRVVALVHSSDGQVWQQNADGLWWGKSSPSGSWEPQYGTSQAPAPTTDPYVFPKQVTLSSTATPIMDASGNQWAILNGQVTLNGVLDQTTQNVTELAYVNGKVWQENASGLWWSKNTPADQWGPTYGTSQSPVPPTTPSPTRTWLGQDGAFENPGAWSPVGVPQSGDTAIVRSGEVEMYQGDAKGVNFFLGGPNASVGFHQGPHNVGHISGAGSIIVDLDPFLRTSVIISGITVASGGRMNLAETVNGNPDTVTLSGDSYLGQGSTLAVQAFNTNHIPYGDVINNGRMTIDGATLQLGGLSGNGTVSLINNANALIVGAGKNSNTIQLQSGHLEAGFNTVGQPGGMSFQAPITNFGADSTITLDNTAATSEVFKQIGATAGEVMLYNGSTLVADLAISGQSRLYANVTPSPSPLPLGTVTISAHNDGHALPITVI